MDVKIALLNGKLEEQILITQPEGFAKIRKENHVYLLHKSLYGLKQFSRDWYKRFDEFIVTNGYHKSRYVSFVYYGGLD